MKHNPFRDIFGNEIRVGDRVLFFKSRSAATEFFGKVVDFDESRFPDECRVIVEYQDGSSMKEISIECYDRMIVVDDPFRYLNESSPSLKKAWDTYRTLRNLSN